MIRLFFDNFILNDIHYKKVLNSRIEPTCLLTNISSHSDKLAAIFRINHDGCFYNFKLNNIFEFYHEAILKLMNNVRCTKLKKKDILDIERRYTSKSVFIVMHGKN